MLPSWLHQERGKPPKLTVIDKMQRKHFETTPRNIGGRRDFNRIEAEGVDPNILEMTLSEFEGEAAQALSALDSGADFSGEIKELILNLIALMAARSPYKREDMLNLQNQLARHSMEMIHNNKELSGRLAEELKSSNDDTFDGIDYDEVSQFIDNNDFALEVPRENHIRMEMSMVEEILPLILRRQWSVARSTRDEELFITSDKPVVLDWSNPSTVAPFHRSSPGHACLETYLWFPVSQNVALTGTFEERQERINLHSYTVAALNSITLHSTYNQLYASSLNFPYVDQNGEIRTGTHLIEQLLLANDK